MTLAIWTSFLSIVEQAVANPENKAAVKIARDGLVMWKDISSVPSVTQFEADIAAYERLRAADVPSRPADPPAPEVQNGVRGGPNAGRMSFDQ
jgi:hypothetical protein